MSVPSLSIRAKTLRTPFYDLPVHETHLFQVKEGVSADAAISFAWAVDGAVREVLQNVIAGNDMDANLAMLCKFAMEAADALRASVSAHDPWDPK